MRLDMSILDANNQPHGPPNTDGGTYLMKRTIEVGPTVSTVVALLYLGLWVAGVFLCCCCLGRSRKIKTLLVWKGLSGGSDNLKDYPLSEEVCNGGPAVHGEVPKRVSIPVEHDPWDMAISRLHQKPPKSQGKGKGKNKSSAYNHDHLVPAPTSPQKLLPPINEEPMPDRIPSGRSELISHGHDTESKGPANTPRATALSDSINLSTMSQPTDTISHSHNETSAFQLYSRNDIYDAYGAPVRNLANAATSRRSLRPDSPLTADSDISRQLQTPSFDAFPLPPRLSSTSQPPHRTFTPTADSMSDTR